MGKKKKEKKHEYPKYTGPTLMDRLPNNRGEWLELVIKFTKRAISNPPGILDQFLIDQAERLTKELEEWRKNESKNQTNTP